MDEKFELACFQIITYVGTARTHFINAIHCAKEGKYLKRRPTSVPRNVQSST